ncbi:S-protein homolog 2-like [Vicia villosa]|uniref:S-protein homolog 2-like n=1 Tax=Vicia villosa TaxID=3911 RepID=UPI00273B8E77|nr:S-protein homolog 2-like [Vicia villosa]
MHNMLAVHVNMVNSLENKSTLTVHCKSADDDLGVHVLQPGDNYGFKFGVSFIAVTQFFCGFTWNGVLHWFDIYIDTSYNRSYCSHCNWNIYESGPCRTLEPRKIACFPWNKNK